MYMQFECIATAMDALFAAIHKRSALRSPQRQLCVSSDGDTYCASRVVKMQVAQA